jgi:hypothetical protein
MRNRAKCKKCEDIIESFHQYDYVTCKCGEIAVDGGTSYFRCVAKNIENFLRIDDEGNDIIPKFIDAEEKANVKPLDIAAKPNRTDRLVMLDEMIKSIEKLPVHAMSSYITHYDYYSLLLLLQSLLRDD